MSTVLKTSASNLLSPVLESEGIEFVDLECEGGGGQQTLRLLIHKQGGVTVRDCQHISKVVRPILDVHKLISGTFNFEVASPGVDRPLTTEADFRRNIGRKIQIEVTSSTEKPSQLSGILKNVKAGKILLKGKTTIQVEISTITKAQIQLMW